MEIKQTSIEWLLNELKKSKHYQQMINEVHQNSTVAIDIIEQAKEMEKEQIIDACNLQRNDYRGMPTYNKSGEAYYNETYGGNNE